jgi:hypothetical protein
VRIHTGRGTTKAGHLYRRTTSPMPAMEVKVVLPDVIRVTLFSRTTLGSHAGGSRWAQSSSTSGATSGRSTRPRPSLARSCSTTPRPCGSCSNGTARIPPAGRTRPPSMGRPTRPRPEPPGTSASTAPGTSYPGTACTCGSSSRSCARRSPRQAATPRVGPCPTGTTATGHSLPSTPCRWRSGSQPCPTAAATPCTCPIRCATTATTRRSR